MPSDKNRYRQYQVTLPIESARNLKMAAAHYRMSEQQMLARAISLGAAFMERELRETTANAKAVIEEALRPAT